MCAEVFCASACLCVEVPEEFLLALTNFVGVEPFSPLRSLSLFRAVMLCDGWFPACVMNSLVTKVLKLVSSAVSLLISAVVASSICVYVNVCLCLA